MLQNSSLIGVSSWAVHDELGAPPFFGIEAGAQIPPFSLPQGALPLLGWPAEIKKRGFSCLHLCHFHLPTRDADYLAELRAAIDQSGLQLHALLVDEGDVTHPQTGRRDQDWIAGWFPVAAQLGAQNVRVIAGKTADEEALNRSVAALGGLARQAEIEGVSLLTENWFGVLDSPDAVRELMARTDEKIELLLDFGNWDGPEKYEKLAQIAPLAQSCHAKANFGASGELDESDYRKCLNLPFPKSFRGPFILVNGGFEGSEILRDFMGQILR